MARPPNGNGKADQALGAPSAVAVQVNIDTQVGVAQASSEGASPMSTSPDLYKPQMLHPADSPGRSIDATARPTRQGASAAGVSQPGGSAASMLHAAWSLAAEASGSADGLESVSTALRGQAAAVVAKAGAENGRTGGDAAAAAGGSSSVASATLGLGSAAAAGAMAGTSETMARRASNSAQYSAALSAQMSSALQSSQNKVATDPASTVASGSGSSPDTAATGQLGATPALMQPESPRTAQAQVGELAARAALMEGESQMRVVAMLQASIGGSTSAQEAAVMLPLASVTGLAARRASASAAAAAAAAASSSTDRTIRQTTLAAAQNSAVSSSDASTVPSYLDRLGLSHITLPTSGFEQAWGRPAKDAGQAQPLKKGETSSRHYWDAGDPRMGFNLAGVPSMPLMPTPPLQMLPPPTSPIHARRGGGVDLPTTPFLSSSKDSRGHHSIAHSVVGSPGLSSTLPYPFQVVQTPGGTARAGWWVPPEHVAPNKRKEVEKLSEGALVAPRLTPSLAATTSSSSSTSSAASEGANVHAVPTASAYTHHVSKEDLVSTTGTRGASYVHSSSDQKQQDFAPPVEVLPLFQPAYRVLQPDEYAVLASAAAYATAALTTTTSGAPFDPTAPAERALKGDVVMERPLSAEEQEAIAVQLRAWAGLQGPEKQAEARQHLEEHQSQIFAQQQQRMQSEARGSRGVSVAEAKLQTSGPQLFPPDFASHYRTQLRALAEGYYTRLHRDGLARDHYAPHAAERASSLAGHARTSGALSSTAVATHPSQLAAFASQPGRPARGDSGKCFPDSAFQPPQVTQPALQSGRQSVRDATNAGGPVSLAEKAKEDLRVAQDGSGTRNADASPLPRQQQDLAREGILPQIQPVVGQDPLDLISAASSAAGVDVHSPTVRDQLLQYAHALYSSGTTATAQQGQQSSSRGEDGQGTNGHAQQQAENAPARPSATLHPTLLPLLHTLHKLHPQHLPTLLLLSCAYYTSGDLAASLHYNKQILRTDPNYVESMSNIGTTLRALGRWREAESWWWRAVRLRPGYWDAYENLLGVLCSPQQASEEEQSVRVEEERVSPSTEDNPRHHEGQQDEKSGTGPRFREALRLCEFVEAHVLTRRSDQDGRDASRTRKVPGGDHPQCMPQHLPTSQVCRLQNLFYAKGNLKYVLPEAGLVPAARAYQQAVEVVLSPSESSAHSLRDLAVATCVAGLLSLGTTLPGSAAAQAASEVALSIGLDPSDSTQTALVAQGNYSQLSSRGILGAVRDSGDRIVSTLLRLGGGQLPMVMLLPDSAVQLVRLLFAETSGALPAMYSSSQQQRQSPANQHQQALQQSAQTTSTILLTLAKLFQDAIANPTAGSHGPLTLGGIPASTSLLLPLYYLSISLHPSASTANNLGILLSSIPVVTHIVNATGQRQQLNGQALALQYYTYGLQLDPSNAHCHCNLGSLLKDLGHINEAIQMYEKAVQHNPTFDVALANLGNAIKDQGRTQESVQYYRRAVDVNPRFPEALCGLVNALLAICDWREVYSEKPEWAGWMTAVRSLLTKQLQDGASYGVGALQATATLQGWVDSVQTSLGDRRKSVQQQWTARFEPFFRSLDREKASVNEGSFVIRLIERLLRRIQRRWYLSRYGHSVRVPASEAQPQIQPQASDVQQYPRLALPSCLVTPAVPTVLPFHTFTLKILPRHIRLISHRNALRLTQQTLSQQWLPAHVYPPPPPPASRLRIGYVSSDFNNHPLAHLMQSVFGMHDPQRFEIFLYATTASDGSPYRQKIEKEAQNFYDVSTWSNQQIVQRVLADGCHILMNLNGYTKGARNEIFAARPCPVQMEFMGFAGGLASGWIDWLIVDPIVCPPEQTAGDLWRTKRREALEQGTELVARPTDFAGDLDPEEPSDDWMYTERCVYMPKSYFVCDHRQGFREPEERRAIDGRVVHPHEMSDEEAWAEEEQRRWKARKELFPSIPDDFVIFCCFNQLYKLEPEVFKAWLEILKRVPNSIIWLLRFPAAGEVHLMRAAREWAGDEVASRIVFTEVAPKGVHIHRGRIADLFLDAWECGAHTTSADILWSGTPVLTWPKHLHKMCSRVAASIVHATGHGDQMIVNSEEAYIERAVALAQELQYEYWDGKGNSLPAVASDIQVTAEALCINTASGAAQPHVAPQQQQSQATSEGAPAAQKTGAPGQTTEQAPANVKQNAANAANAPTREELAEVSPPRSQILLKIGPQAPAGARMRRGAGELSDLRRKLFLERDRDGGLFDTKAWTRALEAGYEEAWRRYVAGTDVEDSPEWEALPEDAPEKLSAHIWVRDE
ncbi:O-linked N-acetylglucosamine transferase OGT [Ceraceosorus bombacis]|uniref:protein O-GlcNAc transferase n=1 Tax=Ceraceosorus bombacis TaxID=401625 RepID=A0A0P1BCZ2_9BASI|nr:O-linked N-acetylglucosamine transferase OGT [Ceraceosorus bombacis]